MKTVDDREAAREALELLAAAATPGGFVASPEERSNYRRVWARDGVISGLAALVAGDERLTAALRATLETLARHRGPDGQIPSNVLLDAAGAAREVSLGGAAGRVDTIPWFVVGVSHYVERTGDRAFGEQMAPAVDQGLRLLEVWELNRRGLVYVPQSGTWCDEYYHHGYLLHVQLLRLWALRSAARTYGWSWSARAAGHLAELVRVNFWPRPEDRGHELIYHPPVWSAWVEERGEPGYGLCGLLPGGYLDQFDALANALAVLLDVPSSEQVERLLDHGQSLRDLGPTRLVPCYWPPVTEHSPEWAALRGAALYGFKNHPGSYHNGGVWPMINGWWGMALAAAGREHEAREILVGVDRLNRRDAADEGEAWGFYEFADCYTGAVGGARHLAWSAAGRVLLAGALSGRALGFAAEPGQ